MNPTQPVTDDTTTTKQQGGQTNGVVVPGPFGGQTATTPIPPMIDPLLNTGSMPPFQFNQNDFGFGGDSNENIKNNTNITQTPEPEVDPFAGGIASLSTNNIPEQNNTINTTDNINFDLPDQFTPDNTNTDMSSTVNDFTLPTDISLENSTEESNQTTTNSNISENIETNPQESENQQESEDQTESNSPESENVYKETIPEYTEEEPSENNITEETTNTNNETSENNESNSEEEIESSEEIEDNENNEKNNENNNEGGEEETLAASNTDYETTTDPYTIEETFNNFVNSLQQLLQLKNTNSVNILGHRTDDEEVQYEFNHESDALTTVIRHHSLASDGTSSMQTLGFDNSDGLKVTFNDDIISHYGVEDEDEDTTYYLNDKLSKFTTMINDEINKEEKKRKEEKSKRKKTLELLRSF